MPARRPQNPPSLEVRSFTPEKAQRAIALLEARIAEIKGPDPTQIRHDDERVADTGRRFRSTILEFFGERSAEYQAHQYRDISGSGGTAVVVGWDADPEEEERKDQRRFAEGIPRTITILEGLIRTVRERTIAAPSAGDGRAPEGPPVTSNEVFIVHGRNEGAREAVARFVERLGLRPIILHEQANQGRTIIEKFEGHAVVGYAVVLLTGDDRGGLPEADPATYKPRARQNVILELGYFLGTLRRRNVAVLYEEGVEIPSDYQGVAYVPLDPGGAWRLLLAREMKAAGLDVDLNLAM